MATQRRRNTQQSSGVPGRGYVPPASQEPVRQQPYQPNPYSAQMPPQTMYNPRPMKQNKRKNWLVWLVIAVLAVEGVAMVDDIVFVLALAFDY